MNTIKIIGNEINTFNNRSEALDIILKFLEDGKQHHIVTANPEILLTARHDEELYYIINKADLVVPDGFGLKIACLVSGSNTKRIVGADLTQLILKISEKQNKKVAVLSWKDGLAKSNDIKKTVIKIFPALQLFTKDIDRNTSMFYDDISQFQPDILLVGLGAPWQEKIIYHSLPKLPSVKLAIGVGGSFDFITGKITRAPKFIRLTGMEWLWRLAKQPKRWKRITNAAIVFPMIFIKQHFINRFFYRKNVVAFIFNDQRQVLILNWARNTDYWGLPQGGVDLGENDDEAIKREIEEETGIKNFEIKAKYKNIYSYKWPKEFFHFGFKGQKQTLYILRILDDINSIKVSYWEHKEWKWVSADEFIKESHPVHEKAYKIFLEKYNQVLE